MKKEIAVVSNHDSFRSGLSFLLSSEGYAVNAFSKGADLMKAFGKKRPALVILDFGMPSKGALQTCAALRAADNKLPVMIISAADTEDNELVAFRAGADDFVFQDASVLVKLARIAALLRHS